MSIRVQHRQATPDELEVLDRHWLPPRWHAALTSIAAFFLYLLLACGVMLAGSAILIGMANKLDLTGYNVDIVLDPWQKALLIAVIWTPVAVLPAALAVRRYRGVKAQRLEVWRDRHAGEIEVINVDGVPYTTV